MVSLAHGVIVQGEWCPNSQSRGSGISSVRRTEPAFLAPEPKPTTASMMFDSTIVGNLFDSIKKGRAEVGEILEESYFQNCRNAPSNCEKENKIAAGIQFDEFRWYLTDLKPKLRAVCQRSFPPIRSGGGTGKSNTTANLAVLVAGRLRGRYRHHY